MFSRIFLKINRTKNTHFELHMKYVKATLIFSLVVVEATEKCPAKKISNFIRLEFDSAHNMFASDLLSLLVSHGNKNMNTHIFEKVIQRKMVLVRSVSRNL